MCRNHEWDIFGWDSKLARDTEGNKSKREKRVRLYVRYTHKTSGFKTSGFKTSGFKTSETSGLQNVRFTKHPVLQTSGL
jgi:hypothetical protein